MKIKCPSCGASMSLDVLIAHDEARDALVELTGISDELVRGCLKYLTLFRPAEKDLTFARVAKLVGEIAPMIRAGEISRNRQSHPAPREAWIWAFGRCLEARDMGKLKTPLTSHGYLLENITFWTPEKTAGMAVAVAADAPAALSSKLRQGVSLLSQWAGGDWLKQEIAAGFATLAAMNLKNRPAAPDLSVLAGLWERRLLERIVAVEGTQFVEELDRPRIQAAFKSLQDVQEWPNVIDLIRNLPPRIIPRDALPNKKHKTEAGMAQMQKIKDKLKKGSS